MTERRRRKKILSALYGLLKKYAANDPIGTRKEKV